MILDKADALRAKCRAALAHLDILTQSIFLDMFGEPVTNPIRWDLQALSHLGVFCPGIKLKSAKSFNSDGDRRENGSYFRISECGHGIARSHDQYHRSKHLHD